MQSCQLVCCAPAVLTMMRTSPNTPTESIHCMLDSLLQLCNTTNVHLDFIWESRESSALLQADMVSRLEGNSNVCLSHAAFKRVCMQVSGAVRLGFSTLDVFAGHASQQHVVSRYYTQYHAPQAPAQWAEQVPCRGNLFCPFPCCPMLTYTVGGGCATWRASPEQTDLDTTDCC